MLSPVRAWRERERGWGPPSADPPPLVHSAQLGEAGFRWRQQDQRGVRDEGRAAGWDGVPNRKCRPCQLYLVRTGAIGITTR